MKAPINKIIEFSYVDGPGLRSSIFVQKCNISCLYCHNPETQKICINCGECVSKCPTKALTVENNIVKWNSNICANCDTCINICPNHASPKIKYLTEEEVFEQIKPNIPFIRGITVSGGECMLYPEFLTNLFKLAKNNNLTTLIDSNGTILFKDYPELLKYSDGVMLDVKSWNDDIFKKLTSYSNKNVVENLKYLYSINKIEELRIVYHKDYVDALDIIKGIKDTLNDVSNIKLKLIKFRKNGVKGIMSKLDSPTDIEMNELRDYTIKIGFKRIEVR